MYSWTKPKDEFIGKIETVPKDAYKDIFNRELLVKKLCGSLSEYADPILIRFEKQAWAKAAVQKHKRSIAHVNP